MLWTAFILGLLGGWHCIAMCGPIAMTLPGGGGFAKAVITRISYNSGRIFTYALLGMVAGLVGTGLHLAGLQQTISIISGLTLILIVVISGFKSLEFTYLRPFFKFAGVLRGLFSKLMKKSGVGNSFLIGVTNGFLPCGLVYVALAASLASGSIVDSMAYMAIFGSGTFPLMFAISLSGNFVSPSFRYRFSRVVPFIVFLMGMLFVLRGLDLGIPYVSPQIPTAQTEFDMCED